MKKTTLTKLEKKILREYKKKLKETFGKDLVKFILYGSRARGTARKDSDMDVLIVLNRRKNLKDRLRVSRITTEVMLRHDFRIDLSPNTYFKARYDRFKKIGSPFLISVSNEAISI